MVSIRQQVVDELEVMKKVCKLLTIRFIEKGPQIFHYNKNLFFLCNPLAQSTPVFPIKLINTPCKIHDLTIIFALSQDKRAKT